MSRPIEFRAWHHGGGDPRVEVSMRFSHPFPVLFWQAVEGEQFAVEIMQYTGLTDSNGVKIFEGDIVRCNNGHKGPVKWIECDGCFNVPAYYSSSDDYPSMAFMEGQPFEVIGNIYQTPKESEDE